jgi:hypothetical protein
LKTGTLSLNDLIPRLYPFFRHTIVAVRLAVPQALHLFLTSPAIQTIDWVDARLFRFLYQNLIIEERYEIRTATLQTWVALLDKIGRTSSTTEAAEQFLEAHTKAFLGEWVAIAMSPPGVPLDANLFLKAAAMAPARVSKTGKAADAQAISHNVDKNAMAQDLSLISADEVLKNRIDAAQALALLVHEHGSEVRTSQPIAFPMQFDLYQRSISGPCHRPHAINPRSPWLNLGSPNRHRIHHHRGVGSCRRRPQDCSGRLASARGQLHRSRRRSSCHA